MLKENLKNKKYNIGLDIGVTSVGWSVTDMENNLLKHNSKNMWGVRLFDEAQKADVRRKARTARRRLRRRKERIKILNNLLYEDIVSTDPDFFVKLKESNLIYNDKTLRDSKYNLFKDEDFNDTHFYKEYPTMYHLRGELINNTEKKDIRYVYLAIHHILKYRGNFLYPQKSISDKPDDIIEKFNILFDWLKDEYYLELKVPQNEILTMLQDRNKKKNDLKDYIIKSFNYVSENKTVITNIANALLGYKFSISKIFDVEKAEKDTISFSEELDEEISNILGDNYDMLILIKDIYSWIMLQQLSKGKEYISLAFIEKFNKYKEDLIKLKKLYRKYIPNKYNEMFRLNNEKVNNYYIYNVNTSICTRELLYKKIKSDFEKVKEQFNEDEYKIFEDMENNTFLDKINTTDNGSIPYQSHKKELEKILENQSKYYSTIRENKEKIIDLLEFRIPYYVGPLNNKSKFAWLVKKSDEKIYPWNFDKVVDVNSSAENFILRMIKKCTYLVDESVMPKNSLLYSEFCVLNELNNIRVNDKKLSKETKKLIIEELFKKTKKVTVKNFKETLLNNQQYSSCSDVNISGLSINDKFMSSMTAYIDMKNIFGYVDESNFNMIEEIIYYITIFEDKKILRKKIEEKYPEISQEQLDNILKLRYTGWSNLSKKLLVGIKSNDYETVMDKLRDTNFNFMQIITNKEFGFDKKIEENMPKLESNKITYELISELQGSPAIKKGIWQAVKVVEEIIKVMKYEPENIYIEFARGEDLKKERKDTRMQQLLKVYENIKKDLKSIDNFDYTVYKELKGQSSEKKFNEKLYLYFLQNGKCLYSGKTINLDNLYTDEYEVDHIIPQSYIKDDSLSNKALVYRSENQRKKDSFLLENRIIDSRRPWWLQLKKLGLMTDKKFYNLTRTVITEEDEVKFINRQLVETRQIIKHVTNLLINKYQNTTVFSINAVAGSNFRERYKIYKNRNLNDYHHAHDAYITCVIGNFINKRFKKGKNIFEYTEYLKEYKKKTSDEEKRRTKYGLLLTMLNNDLSDEEAKKIRNIILNYKDCYITKKLEELTGEFYNQTIYKKSSNNLIRLKKDKPTEIYGGYSGENKAYYSIISYIDKKGKVEYQIVGVPVQISYMINNGQITLKEYFESLGYTSCIIIKEKILKYQTYLNENNEQMILVSDRECKINKQLLLDGKYQKIIYLMNKSDLEENEKLEVKSNLKELYEYLLEKIIKEYKTFMNVYPKLSDMKEKFDEMETGDKICFINGIITLLHTGKADMSKFGLSGELGRRKEKFNSTKLQNMKFIDNSVTGMYRKGYQINGMENSNNK